MSTQGWSSDRIVECGLESSAALHTGFASAALLDGRRAFWHALKRLKSSREGEDDEHHRSLSVPVSVDV